MDVCRSRPRINFRLQAAFLAFRGTAFAVKNGYSLLPTIPSLLQSLQPF